MRKWLGTVALVGLLIVPPDLGAQLTDVWDPQGLTTERAELVDLLERTEAVAASTVYSGRERDAARRDAEIIRQRLTDGDFRLGDQITLTVMNETALTGVTLPVEGGPRVTIPGLGPVSLQGVLRSELESHMTQELARWINNPQVLQASSQIRMTIQGDVGAPGFYTAPADMLLSEFIQQVAGGPGAGANFDEMRIERMDQEIWTADELQIALAQGWTLDQMNLRAGDVVILPPQTESMWGTVLRWGLGVAASAALGYGIFR